MWQIHLPAKWRHQHGAGSGHGILMATVELLPLLPLLSSGASLLPTRNVLNGVYWLGDNKQWLLGWARVSHMERI